MKVVDNVYLLDSAKGAGVYLIVDKEIVLIDTGFPWVGKKLLKELVDMGIRSADIKHILLTHHDVDHVGNAAMLQKVTGAALWASEEDIPYIMEEMDRHSFKKYLAKAAMLKKPGKINSYNDSEEFSRLNIKVIPSPGHTPGHVCLLYRDVLFIGDLIDNRKGYFKSFPDAWCWDAEKARESIGKISRCSFEWICPSHGKPVKSRTFTGISQPG